MSIRRPASKVNPGKDVPFRSRLALNAESQEKEINGPESCNDTLMMTNLPGCVVCQRPYKVARRQ
jgi:hypothetical protein